MLGNVDGELAVGGQLCVLAAPKPPRGPHLQQGAKVHEARTPPGQLLHKGQAKVTADTGQHRERQATRDQGSSAQPGDGCRSVQERLERREYGIRPGQL